MLLFLRIMLATLDCSNIYEMDGVEADSTIEYSEYDFPTIPDASDFHLFVNFTANYNTTGVVYVSQNFMAYDPNPITIEALRFEGYALSEENLWVITLNITTDDDMVNDDHFIVTITSFKVCDFMNCYGWTSDCSTDDSFDNRTDPNSIPAPVQESNCHETQDIASSDDSAVIYSDSNFGTYSTSFGFSLFVAFTSNLETNPDVLVIQQNEDDGTYINSFDLANSGLSLTAFNLSTIQVMITAVEFGDSFSISFQQFQICNSYMSCSGWQYCPNFVNNSMSAFDMENSTVVYYLYRM